MDDRNESVGKRIATAETDWVPYYAVVGDQELEEPMFSVTVRGQDDTELSIDALAETVANDVGDKPAKPRHLPRYVSDHPEFA
ncbi:His/Gly/Thr/Pro-type tRNA ligase C-terminal domain-containing protein [Halocatena pleomorpha]|uniref:His/Gly/Thr/Pro-type tRNA ligase C-terminal domain-containing protein n=1 Tax=Halocatena pleomorpha TaxID=1785090 RepID=UPI00227863CE|nr:His/Gly/Thr/Pro-type tRNA ligase C-terminal domain-containing protein [Halocatena pleomorpha]